MSRWAEAFTALAEGADTLDSMRQSVEPVPTVSQSANSVTAGLTPYALPVTTGCRDSASWGEAEEERAAIVAQDGGIFRQWAEGFARLDPDRPPGNVPPKRWRRFVDDVGLFLDSPFCAVAVVLGWGPHDLFGCDRDQPFARVDQAGLLWLLDGGRLVMLAENAAMIETRTGARQTWHRRPNAPGCVLAWELMQ